jgi:hypothetical protein
VICIKTEDVHSCLIAQGNFAAHPSDRFEPFTARFLLLRACLLPHFVLFVRAN